MELLYVWIDDFKSIKKLGFNFSPKHQFDFIPEYDEDNRIFEGALIHIENKNYLPNNFFSKEILNITAIIGKNGAGKSTILNFIFSWIKNFETTYIAVFQDIKSEKIIIYHSGSFKIKNCNEEKYSKLSDYEEENKINIETVCIYYSNTLSPSDLRHFPEQFYNTSKNISTYFLLDEIEKEKKEKLKAKKDSMISILDEFWLNNIIEISKFLDYSDDKYSNIILNLLNKDIGIKSIHVISNNLDILNNFFSNRIIQNNPLLRRKVTDVLRIPYGINESKAKLLNNISILFLALSINNSLNKIYYNSSTILSMGEYDEWSKSLSYNKLFELMADNKFTEYALEIGKKNNVFNNDDLQDYLKLLEAIYNLIVEISEQNLFIENSKKLFDSFNYQAYTETITLIGKIDSAELIYNSLSIPEFEFELPRKNIIEFISIYKRTLEYDLKSSENYLDFKWLISSGELSFINTFSRLLKAKEYIEFQKKEFQNYLILLDEIDLYLHPDLSRRNIDLLSEILPLIFEKPVQLILTTHAPFVISDLPRGHIVLLELDQTTGKCKISNRDSKTFAENIHTLYNNEFFLDSTIGEFAISKINEILNFYHEVNLAKSDSSKIETFKEEYWKEKEQEFKYLLNIIGEKYIRSILESNIKEIEQILKKND